MAQDAAPAHTNNVTLQFLRVSFLEKSCLNVETGHGYHVLLIWQFMTFTVGVFEATDMGRTSQPATSDPKGTSGCYCKAVGS